MDNSKYYFVKRKSDDTYPFVALQNLSQVELGKTKTLEVIIRPPVPRDPVIADFFSGSKDIFSKRITEVMKAMNMEGVKFIPAEIDDTKGKVYDNYECVIVDENTYQLFNDIDSDYVKSGRRYQFKK